MNKTIKIGCRCHGNHYIELEKQDWDNGPDYVIKILGCYSGFWYRLKGAVNLILNNDCFYDEIILNEDEKDNIKEAIKFLEEFIKT